MALDRFSWGAIAIALALEGVILWGWFTSPQDREDPLNLVKATGFPVVLIAVTFLVYRLQRR